jgi:hypothetical protein
LQPVAVAVAVDQLLNSEVATVSQTVAAAVAVEVATTQEVLAVAAELVDY